MVTDALGRPISKAQQRVVRMQRYVARTTPSVQIWEFDERYHREWHPLYQEKGRWFAKRMRLKFGDHPINITTEVLDDHALRTVNKSGYLKIRVEARRVYPR